MAEVEWSRLKAPELRALAKDNAIVIVPLGPPSSTARIFRPRSIASWPEKSPAAPRFLLRIQPRHWSRRRSGAVLPSIT